MNIGECIVVGLCVVVVGLVAIIYIAGKYNMLEDKKNKK